MVDPRICCGNLERGNPNHSQSPPSHTHAHTQDQRVSRPGAPNIGGVEKGEITKGNTLLKSLWLPFVRSLFEVASRCVVNIEIP